MRLGEEEAREVVQRFAESPEKVNDEELLAVAEFIQSAAYEVSRWGLSTGEYDIKKDRVVAYRVQKIKANNPIFEKRMALARAKNYLAEARRLYAPSGWPSHYMDYLGLLKREMKKYSLTTEEVGIDETTLPSHFFTILQSVLNNKELPSSS